MTEAELLHRWNITEPCDQEVYGSYDAFRTHIRNLPKQSSPLKLQPNENRCAFTEHEHVLEIPRCCPVTGNPQPGSTLTIAYKGSTGFLEVAALCSFIDSYVGGRGDVRSMEGMLQEICQACADALSVDVKLTSHLIIEPRQVMRITCYAFPAQR